MVKKKIAMENLSKLYEAILFYMTKHPDYKDQRKKHCLGVVAKDFDIGNILNFFNVFRERWCDQKIGKSSWHLHQRKKPLSESEAIENNGHA